MEQYRVVLCDRQKRLSEESTMTVAGYLLAALAADPRTLSELETAVGRFGPGTDLSWFSDVPITKPHTRKILLIDLPARLICSSPELGRMFPRGEVTCRIEKDMSDFPVRFWISDEWKFVESEEEFQKHLPMRRMESESNIRPDFRKILYGRELSEFIAARFDGNAPECHASWLTSSREDLSGRSPRQILLQHQERVDFDLYSRELQWSFMGECPPLIPVDSDAYRFAGFGTHEFVIYYDLIRHLLDNFTDDIEQLEELKAKWLESPSADGPSRIPADMIDSERRRLPLEATASEMMIDEDCPICQMMLSEFDTPTFLHLDSAHFEDGYVFSSYRTEEEWLKNRREWEEFNRRFEESERVARDI